MIDHTAVISELTTLRLFLLCWGCCALAIRTFYARRSARRNALPDSTFVNPHPYAVVAVSTWILVLALFTARPDLLQIPGFYTQSVPSVYQQIVGITGLVLGLYLLARAHQELGEFYGVRLFLKESHETVSTGPYALVRHPMYTAYMVWILSTLVFVPQVGLALMLPVAWLGFSKMAEVEENMLTQALGKDYGDYINETGRFIPWV